jgi:N-acetylglucosaminyl-diphospho-decaprenol L-rhamnosyltransferase
MSRPVRAVVLNWNMRERTDRCLDALLASRGVEVDVVVVDNGSAGDDARHFRRRLGPDRVLGLPENIGYAGGMNAGIAFWRRPGEPTPVLILTPDATVTPDTVRLLADELEATPDAGVVGPLVAYNRELGLTGAGGMVDPRRAAVRPVRMPVDRRPYDTHWIDGCCMLLRTEALEAVLPPFDPAYFMYFEETEFCGRARQAGWRVRVVPAAVVDHPKQVGGQAPWYYYYAARNRYRFWRRNHGVRFPRVAAALLAETARSWASVARAALVSARRPELGLRFRDARLQTRGAVQGTRDYLAGRTGRMPDGRMG